MPRVIYDSWMPDQPPFLSKGLQAATNVYAAPLGYRPVRRWQALTAPLASSPKGAATFVSPEGNTIVIAGTSDRLYQSSTINWTMLGGGFTATDDSRWRFAQFGSLAIATNGTDPMQKVDLETLTLTALGGSPPRAKILTVVKDFLVAAVINDDIRTLQWSGINDAEWWTPALNQSDYQIFPTGGEITGLLGGEVGIILQRGRISRMTYVGGNLIFQFDEISYNIGCVSRHSVAQAGQFGFFLSDNGFMMWTGAELKPIGFERVDRTFAASYSQSDWATMSTAIDLKNNLVCWSMTDRMFVYNWVLDKWSVIEHRGAIAFSGFTRAFTLEEIGEIFPTLEEIETSLDSDIWLSGNPAFYAFDEDYRLGAFLGQQMEAELSLSNIEFAPGREARLSQVRPITDAMEGITLSIEARARLGEEVTANEYAYLTDSGDMPVRESGRHIKISQLIAEGTEWTFSQGLDVGVNGMARGGRH